MEECYDAQEEIDAAEHLEMQELEEAHRHDLAEERELAASSAEGNTTQDARALEESRWESEYSLTRALEEEAQAEAQARAKREHEAEDETQERLCLEDAYTNPDY